MRAQDMVNEDTRLTREKSVTQDYLKMMWSVEERTGEGASVLDLAQKMGVAASTASEKVKRLAEQGLITHRPYQKAHLTDEGRALAIAMVRRHRILETYLHDLLGFDWDEVHEEAEILEHAVSDRLLERLNHALGYPTRDPHGDPIPAEDGSVHRVTTIPLSDLTEGQGGRILRISDDDPEILRSLERVGIGLDAHVTVLARTEDNARLLLDERELILTHAEILALEIGDRRDGGAVPSR